MTRSALASIFILCVAVSATNADQLWLDKADVVVSDGKECELQFSAPQMPQDAKPLLWIAARVEYFRETKLWPGMALELNGVPLQLDRIAIHLPRFTLPAYGQWPILSLEKCQPYGNKRRWIIRFDNDDIVGNDPADPKHYVPLYQRWSFLSEDTEPSYAIDLSGLVRPGVNALRINYAAMPGFPPAREDTLGTQRACPQLALNIRFVKIGLLSEGEVSAYNKTHMQTPTVIPRAFNLLEAEGFRKMIAYCENVARTASDPQDKAYFHMAAGWVLRWEGRMQPAEEHFQDALAVAPQGEFAAEALFLLSACSAQRGDRDRAACWRERLAKEHGQSSWMDMTRREMVLPDADAALWPMARATRVSHAPVIDGKLDDAVWSQADAADEFILYPTKYRKFPLRTTVQFAYDERALYAAFQCHEPVMDEISNPHTERDSPVWLDDCVEIFLDPGRSCSGVYEFQIGAKGGTVDVLTIGGIAHMGYDAPTTSRAALLPGQWQAEIAIPWECLMTRMPNAGDVWLMNAARNRPKTANREAMLGSLGPATEKFAASDIAAWLVFGPAVPAQGQQSTTRADVRALHHVPVTKIHPCVAPDRNGRCGIRPDPETRRLPEVHGTAPRYLSVA